MRSFNPKLPLHFFIDFQADDLCMEDVEAHRADSKKPSSGSSSFSVRGEKINWIPCVPPFKTLGDHWTGGRIGMYALCFGMKDSENKNGHEEIGGAKIISVEVFKK